MHFHVVRLKVNQTDSREVEFPAGRWEFVTSHIIRSPRQMEDGEPVTHDVVVLVYRRAEVLP